MAQIESMDFLDDLFTDVPYNSPGASSSDSSLFSDSGHGSPESLPSTNSTSDFSPKNSFQWDNLDEDGWGSILDELPSELASDSDTNSNSIINDPLLWLNGNTNVESLETENQMSMLERTSSDLKNQDNNDDLEFSKIKNEPMVSMEMLLNEISSKPPTKTDTSNKIALKTPLILKPVVINSGTIKSQSHIKIGNNIFTIVQKSKPSVSMSVVTKPQSCESTTVKPEISSLKICQPGLKNKPSFSSFDHDYIEDDFNDNETTGVSKGFGPGLSLTDEEKKLLDLESIIIPEDAPLTKEEEKSLKKIRRKIKNKQSAMESRRRRKEYIENLEKRVKHCTNVNQGLKKKVDKLSEDNMSLLLQLKQLQTIVAASVTSNRNVTKGTCLAVLLLSFAMFYLPFNPVQFNGASKGSVTTDAPVTAFRSRTLLSLPDTKDHIDHIEHNESDVYIRYLSTTDEKDILKVININQDENGSSNFSILVDDKNPPVKSQQHTEEL